MFLAVAARGETVELSVEGSLSERLVSLDVFERNGIAYVSLRSIVEQAGGAFSVLPTRARVDLYGETAWVRAGEARVHALSIFSLNQPILQDGEYLLIAVADLTDFFQKSFRKNVRVIGGGTTAPAPAAAPGATAPPAGAPPAAVSGPRIIETPRTAAAPVQGTPPPESAAPGELERLATKPAPKVPGQYKTLVIDPGHGGSDTGAQADNAISEEDLALALAKLLKARIAADGPIRALLTREADSDLPEARRQSAITSVRPDFVISIHLGTSLSPAVTGIATFYAPPLTITTGGLLSGGVTTATIGEDMSAESQRLAQAIGSALETSTGTPLRGVVQAPIRALQDVAVPSVLVEVGCMTGPNAAQTLADPVYQGRIVEGIAAGVNAFAANKAPDAPAPAEN